jgi:hypothetical protein
LELLTKRIIEVMPEEVVPYAADILLKTIMLGEEKFRPMIEERWTDPFALLGKRRAVRCFQRSSEWHSNWKRLINGVESEKASLRRSAFHRGHILFHLKCLSDQEIDELDRAIWSQVDDLTGLPKCSGFYLSAFLYLPKAKEHGVRAKIKNRLMHQEFPSWKFDQKSISFGVVAEVKNIFDDMCRIFRPKATAKSGDVVMALNERDAEKLARKILNWWPEFQELLDKTSGEMRMIMGDVESLSKAVFAAIGEMLLFHLSPGCGLACDLEKRLEDLERCGIPRAGSSIGRLFQNSDRSEAVKLEIEEALITDDENELHSGVKAAIGWARAASASILPPLPGSLVQLVVSRFTLRQRPLLGSVINCLMEIFQHQSELISNDQRNMIFLALEKIADETEPRSLQIRYHEGDIDRVGVSESLHIREWSSALASKLAGIVYPNGENLPQGLQRWREICNNDPLPEVRRDWHS